MDSIQKLLREQLKQLPGEFLKKIVARKLKDAGVEDYETIAPKLAAHIISGADNALTIDDGGPSDITVDVHIDDHDLAEISDRVKDFMDNKFPEVIRQATSESGNGLAKTLKNNWPDQAEWQDTTTENFLCILDYRWGESIDLLRMLLTIAREVGEGRAKRLQRRKRHKAPTLQEVLLRLHARACQVTEEVITLLQNGFADGAMARWRTLHEISVVASILAEHGEELAVRYADHEVVEAKAAMDDYERHLVPLGYTSYPVREKNKIIKGYTAAVTRYGKEFTSSYGWAAAHLNKPKPIFADLEVAAKHSQMRPYYRMASYNVHASAKGIFFRLSSLDRRAGAIAGRSVAGLADPGIKTAQTLVLSTFMLYGPKFSVKDLVAMHAITQLGHEAGEAFMRAHRKLGRDYSQTRRKAQ